MRSKNLLFMEGKHDVEATSSAPMHIEIRYITPRREGAPRVRVPMNEWYIIHLPKIPAEVMAGKIPELRYVDHDFHDVVKFPKFLLQYYMRLIPTKEDKPPELQFQ